MKETIDAFEQKTLPTGGASPIAMKLAINATFNGWRFGMAALLYWILIRARPREFSAADVKGGAAVGLFFAAGMFAQIAGLRYTLPSISSFLTALVVVFAPFAQAFFFRRPVSGRTWAAVAVAVAGTVLLAQPSNATALVAVTEISRAPFPYMGEILTIVGALFFTGQLLALDHYGKSSDTSRLTLVMFSVTAAFSLLLGLALGGAALYETQILQAVSSDRKIALGLLNLIVFSSVLALHLMNKYQPLISPAVASVIYCLEPLFATAFSVALSAEALTAQTLGGGALILLAVLIVVTQQRAPNTQAAAG